MANTPHLGQGIYTAADAAAILRMEKRKTKYWFQYYVKNRLFETAGHRYHYEISDMVAVDFLTLITMAVFFELKAREIPTQRIIKYHTKLSTKLNTPYPFASQDLYTYQKLLLTGDPDGELRRVDTWQPIITGVLKGLAKKISFNEEKLAHKFHPLGKNKSIVVNPENQFGLPRIEGTNILTDTIYDMVTGGVDKKEICKSYGITLKNVEDVIEFSQAA